MKSKLLILSALLSLFSCVADEVASTGDIAGVVKDRTTSETLQGCLVSLTPSGKSTSTGTDGRYEFRDLEPENYSLEFSKEGYNAEKKSVAVVAGRSATADVMLSKKEVTLALRLSEESLDFGDLESSRELFLSVDDAQSVNVSVKSNASWLHVSPESGVVTKSGLKLTVLVDRDGLSENDYSSSLTISSSLGSITVPVMMKVADASAPEVKIAGDFYEITETSFKIDGLILKTGGSPITSYGHCWAEKPEPTINDSKTNLGGTSEVGEYTSTANKGLATGKTYYVRAYAENKHGVGYSESVQITLTKIEKAKVETLDAAEVKNTSAKLVGKITDRGGGEITECGFYYGKTKDTQSKYQMQEVKNDFILNLTELEEGTTYYYKAYAVNAKGESCGQTLTFTTKKEETENLPWDGTTAKSFGGGSGTFIDPYLIETPRQLAYIESSGKTSAYYKLVNDIDLNNMPWNPIPAFSGHFDGNGKAILNLKVTRFKDNAGLFEKVSGEVKSLTIKGVSINLTTTKTVGALTASCSGKVTNCHVIMTGDSQLVGAECVGALVGTASNGTEIEGCTVSSGTGQMYIKGNTDIGGIVGRFTGNGYQETISIKNCMVRASIGGQNNVGGIIGNISAYMSGANISNTGFVGDLTGASCCGGIIGTMSGYSGANLKVITSCMANANITNSEGNAGGLIGYVSSARYNVISSYAIVNFTLGTTSGVGGLIGNQYDPYNSNGPHTIECCYAVPESNTDAASVGGIIGRAEEGRVSMEDVYTSSSYLTIFTRDLKDNYCYTKCNGSWLMYYMQGSGSEYLSNWNFSNTFTATATIDGEKQSVTCPRLSWESSSSAARGKRYSGRR